MAHYPPLDVWLARSPELSLFPKAPGPWLGQLSAGFHVNFLITSFSCVRNTVTVYLHLKNNLVNEFLTGLKKLNYFAPHPLFCEGQVSAFCCGILQQTASYQHPQYAECRGEASPALRSLSKQSDSLKQSMLRTDQMPAPYSVISSSQ